MIFLPRFRIHADSYLKDDSVAWCRETKAVMGLAWFVFGLRECSQILPREFNLTIQVTVMISVVSWIRLQESEEREGLGHDDESMREPYRAAEAGNYVASGGRTDGRYINGGVTGGYVNGAPGVQYAGTGVGAPGQNVIYQQPGHNIVMQNGQIRQIPVGQPIY